VSVCGVQSGHEDANNHRWFATISWQELASSRNHLNDRLETEDEEQEEELKGERATIELAKSKRRENRIDRIKYRPIQPYSGAGACQGND
jgi:hypothetical protein